jgi:hypothetical protein
VDLTWIRFVRPEQFNELLAEVGRERRKLREAESKIKADAEPMAVKAMQLGMPREKVAELTGYSPPVLEKWEGSAAARQAHKTKQDNRDVAKAQARDRQRNKRSRPKPSRRRHRRK